MNIYNLHEKKKENSTCERNANDKNNTRKIEKLRDETNREKRKHRFIHV